jgi:peptidoglycan/xylan/chitin deacetylase (PgdA/CDA1 family)
MLIKALKLLWAYFLYYTNFLDLYLCIKHKILGQNLTAILLYHRVIPKESAKNVFSLPGIIVSQDSFEKQMGFLSKKYNVISLDDYINMRQNQNTLFPKTVVITFDDGWKDNYLYAFPILKKYMLPVTIFLTAGFIGTRNVFWPEKVIFLINKLLALPESAKRCFRNENTKMLQPMLNDLLKNNNKNVSLNNLIATLKNWDTNSIDNLIKYLEKCLNAPEDIEDINFLLDWDQVREMKEYHVCFGSHGISHSILTGLSNDVIKKEIALSKQSIEKEVKAPVDNFAYPNGNYNENVIAYVKTAGYSSALTVEHGINTSKTDLYRLKRINIHQERLSDLKGNFSEELFAAYLAGLL